MDSDVQDRKSRSQAKREFRALAELGTRLAGLSERQLRDIPLSEGTRDALLTAKKLTRTALRRQLRHITSLLAAEDVDAVRTSVERVLRPHATEVAAMHRAERWRDRLLSGDEEEVAAVVEEAPGCDRRRLGQLLRNARRERELGKPPRSARELFRYLRHLFDERD